MATGRFMQSGSACMMDEFRSDHACMIQNSETEREFMHAASQSARAPAGSGQLAEWRMSVTHASRAIERPQARAYAWGRPQFTLRAPWVFRSP